MATQTFKIGLSDTDKQNMAQNVYERLIDMCFDEYDNTKTYNEGDFVVYNDVLYKCKEDNVTGAWDSSKWETATFQDLVDDVEGAVASVNGKANIIDLENGTLVVAKAQIAQQIANVGDDVGSTQDEPFIFQATATDNGITSAETAPIAKHLEKQGNSVVVNNYARPLISAGGWWVGNNASATFSDGKATITISAQAGYLYQNSSLIKDHKYLILGTIEKNVNDSIYFNVRDFSNDHWYYVTIDQAKAKQTVGSVFTALDSGATTIRLGNNTALADAHEYIFSKIILIDLTQWGFNADEITDLTAHPENFFRYYQGSLAYNAGTLTTSNGRYLKTIGRQQWDEEWEDGSFYSNGNLKNSADEIRSKNYIEVLSNTNYYIKSSNVIVIFYDENKNFIQSGYYRGNETFTTTNNTAFVKFGTNSTYGTTYNHDITISIYYADGVDYDKYFAYEEHTYDTGTETLLSAGSVRDIKLPSGEITRKIGYIDLGTDLTFSYNSTYNAWVSNETLSDYKYSVSIVDAINDNIICDKYELANSTEVLSTHSKTNTIVVGSSLKVWIYNGSSTTQPSGTLNFELATPATEQGTSFPENIDVDNYGSMLWLDTSNNSVTIPQGSQFFYPADYVEFIDSLYTRSKDNGDTADVTNIVVQSEIDDTALASRGYIKLASITGYDATKTQTLKNVEGTFTWVDD